MPETFTADRRRVPGRAVALPTLARAILLSLTALLVLAGLIAGPNAVTARAEGTASTFVVTASLGLDGTLKVRQDITFAGQAPAEVKQTLEFKKDLLGDRRYVYELSGFQATVGGQPFDADAADRAGSLHRRDLPDERADRGQPRVLGGRCRDRHPRGHRLWSGRCCRASTRPCPSSRPPSRYRRRSPSSSATRVHRTPRCPASTRRPAPTTLSSHLPGRSPRSGRVRPDPHRLPGQRPGQQREDRGGLDLGPGVLRPSAAAGPGSGAAHPGCRRPVRPAPTGRGRRGHRRRGHPGRRVRAGGCGPERVPGAR